MRLRRPAPVRAVVLEAFTTRLGFGMVTFGLPLYALELGFSLTQIGALIGAKALIEPAVKPWIGRVVDARGPRLGYLAAVIVRFLASALLLVATTPLTLFGVRLLQGAASAARDPASIGVIAATTRTRLGRTFSLSIGAKDLGNICAGAAAGLVLGATGSFTVLWSIVAGLALVPPLIVWLWVPAELRLNAAQPTPAPHGPRRRPSVPLVLRDRRLRGLATFGLLAGATAHMTHGMFQVLAVTVAGVSPTELGLIYTASALVLLVVGPLAGWLADRRGPGPLSGARGIANAASSLIYLLAPGFGGLLAGRLVDDAGKAAFRPTWGSLIAAASHRHPGRGGRVIAGLDTSLSVGEALGPLLAALLWDWWGLAAFLGTRIVLGVGTELLVTRRLKALERAGRTAEPTDSADLGAGVTLRATTR